MRLCALSLLAYAKPDGAFAATMAAERMEKDHEKEDKWQYEHREKLTENLKRAQEQEKEEVREAQEKEKEMEETEL